VTEEERCAEAKRHIQLSDAFRRGDLEALRAEAGDPALVPNGQMPLTIGTCLVYAIYHSPLAFIRTLLEIGADPNAPVNDGFPPLIAALSCTRDAPGARRRTDVDEIVRLLLSFNADIHERGINDYTPVHMAVAERNLLAVQRLLDAGANPDLRTRIDECQTPLEMAESIGWTDGVELLARRGKPLRKRLRSGLTLLTDLRGAGEPVRRQHNYRFRLRMWLNKGDAVRWKKPWGTLETARLDDNGETLIAETRIDRHSLISGLFYGIDGMRVGGTRRLEIAPHLAYGDSGIPDVIPAGAVLTAEVTILAASGAQ
jgi:uncharacterized protein